MYPLYFLPDFGPSSGEDLLQKSCKERFGPYRQLSGDQYNISIRQVFECEKKLRMLSVLKLCLPLNNQSINLMNLQEVKWNEMTEEQNLDVYKFNIDVTDNDVHQYKEVLPIIIYLAGYCCNAVF